jgi:hypothetical protein
VKTKAKQDAFENVTLGLGGCLAGTPSIEYLEALRRHLHEKINDVEEELYQACQRAHVAAEAEPCDCGACADCVPPWNTPESFE